MQDETRSELTRRRFVQLSVAVSAAAALPVEGALAGKGPQPVRELRKLTASGHLKRSSYEGLSQPTFSERGGVELELVEISDLTRAAADADLQGADDAFALMLEGPAEPRLEQGVQRLSHPDLGSFDLFLVPVERPGERQAYEVVVDRVMPPRRLRGRRRRRRELLGGSEARAGGRT